MFVNEEEGAQIVVFFIKKRREGCIQDFSRHDRHITTHASHTKFAYEIEGGVGMNFIAHTPHKSPNTPPPHY